MALNDKPCGQCVNFDRIKVGTGKRSQPRHGLCMVHSVYPAHEEPGQEFPAGVKRAPEGVVVKTYPVRLDQVVSHCAKFRGK